MTRPTQFGRVVVPDEAWLATQPPEPILDADLSIIDTHHHLWERPDHRYQGQEVGDCGAHDAGAADDHVLGRLR